MTDLNDVIERLRSATRQYRHNDDNSPDLLNPREGFVIAYDKAEVDAAIRDLEALRDAQKGETERLHRKLQVAYDQIDRIQTKLENVYNKLEEKTK